MIKIPYEEVLKRIETASGLSQEQIKTKIQQKLDELHGLVSQDGAAHIVANELGISLFESKEGPVKIKEILPGIGSVETIGKVTQIFDIREFANEKRSGKVGSLILGDETGTIRITCWNDQTEMMREAQVGDIVKVLNGYVKENKGRPEIHLNDRSTLVRNPEGISIGEVKKSSVIRKDIKNLQAGESAELLGTIVQSFEPRYFESCPECGKRVKMQGEQFTCEKHGAVRPNYSYVVNFILDDGTGTLRVVAFREQTQQLMEKTHEQLIEMKSFPETFEAVKYDLLGKLVKVRGKVNKNDMFDRVELVSYEIEHNPSAEAELARLSQ